jgi:copper resistance protein C
MRSISSSMFAVAVLLAPTDAAFAHAHLSRAMPPVDGTVTQPPHEATISFTEAVEPRFSTIEVTNAAGQRVDEGQPHIVGGDGKRLAVGLQALDPGTYAVVWHATSVDTHKTDGSYHFTVAPTDGSGISIEHAWARATAGTASTGAAYLTVTDNGQPDHLVSLSTPIATSAELHETTRDNGVMKMRPVTAIVLEPGKPVVFLPGGYHVMLMATSAEGRRQFPSHPNLRACSTDYGDGGRRGYWCARHGP